MPSGGLDERRQRGEAECGTPVRVLSGARESAGDDFRINLPAPQIRNALSLPVPDLWGREVYSVVEIIAPGGAELSLKNIALMLQKVLLMGKSGAGKTSMRSIIFANYLARDTMRLGATIDVEHSHVRFLGNLVLNLWDCGGQEAFMENYFELQRDHIFRNVQVLIYVFDIESRELAKDMEYYASCLQALKQNSKSAKVFCLVHKMDLIPEEQREEVFQQRQLELMRLAQPLGLMVACFKTSIWDETLYRAWSQMVYSLIPNRDNLQSHLEQLCEVL